MGVGLEWEWSVGLWFDLGRHTNEVEPRGTTTVRERRSPIGDESEGGATPTGWRVKAFRPVA